MTLWTVFITELLKLRRSRVTWLSWLAFSNLPLAAALFAWIVRDPIRAAQLGLLGKKAQLAGLRADANGYFELLLQATGLAGMILVSVIAAYVFGREYAEGTAKNWLATATPRHWFVVAKLVVVMLWFGSLVASLLVEGAMLCWWMGLPGASVDLLAGASRDIMLAALVAWLLCPSVAWLAIFGRGYLAPLGFAIAMLIMGNVLGATGWGRWFPWSIVPLFAGVAGPRSETLAPGSLVVLAAAFVAGVVTCMLQLRLADNTQ